MQRKIGSVIFAVMLCSSLVNCGTDTSSQSPVQNDTEPPQTQEETTATEPIGYVTITPPEGGWTTEEIMNVTYFCDCRLNYPLSMEYLGGDFSLSNYSKFFVKNQLVPATLNYKGEYLANATVVKPHDETMIYNIVLFPETCQNIRDVEPFVINGIKMYDSFEDVISALGEDNCYKSESSLMYRDRETNEDLYSLFFENGQLVHININFRFEIDLPLYQRNR